MEHFNIFDCLFSDVVEDQQENSRADEYLWLENADVVWWQCCLAVNISLTLLKTPFWVLSFITQLAAILYSHPPQLPPCLRNPPRT